VPVASRPQPEVESVRAAVNVDLNLNLRPGSSKGARPGAYPAHRSFDPSTGSGRPDLRHDVAKHHSWR
jgi:hypothetical protein